MGLPLHPHALLFLNQIQCPSVSDNKNPVVTNPILLISVLIILIQCNQCLFFLPQLRQGFFDFVGFGGYAVPFYPILHERTAFTLYRVGNYGCGAA